MTTITKTKGPVTAPTSPIGLAQNAELPKTEVPLSAYDPTTHVAEGKMDGWRLLAHRTEDGVHLYSRTGKSQDGKLPAIEAEIMARFPAGTWLDGEAVHMEIENGTLTHDWAKVQSVLGSSPQKAALQSGGISFMVFDLISHGGIDARALPYQKRRQLLEAIFAKGGFERLILTPQVQPTDASLQALLAQGYEGMVIKRRSARYASGKRGEGWTKIKLQDNEDVIVMGFKPGENGFAGMVGAVVFGQIKDGKLTERGRCSGMDMQTRKAMTANPDAWIGTVIEIAHMGIMESGSYRHPQMKRRRLDKPAHECTWTEVA